MKWLCQRAHNKVSLIPVKNLTALIRSVTMIHIRDFFHKQCFFFQKYSLFPSARCWPLRKTESSQGWICLKWSVLVNKARKRIESHVLDIYKKYHDHSSYFTLSGNSVSLPTQYIWDLRNQNMHQRTINVVIRIGDYSIHCRLQIFVCAWVHYCDSFATEWPKPVL